MVEEFADVVGGSTRVVLPTLELVLLAVLKVLAPLTFEGEGDRVEIRLPPPPPPPPETAEEEAEVEDIGGSVEALPAMEVDCI